MSYIGPPPNMTTAARDALAVADRPTGTIIYNTSTNQLEVNGGSAATPAWQGLGKKTLTTTGNFGSLTPADGDEAILQVDATNGIDWRFRYNAGSASAYKWEFVGGSPIEVYGSFGQSSTAWANNAAMTLTVPRNGEYLLEVSATLYMYQSMNLFFWPGQATPGSDPADVVLFHAGSAQTTGITVDSSASVGNIYRRTRALTAGTASVYSRSNPDSQFGGYPVATGLFTLIPRRVS